MNYLHLVVMKRGEFSTHDYIDVTRIEMNEDGSQFIVERANTTPHIINYDVLTHDAFIMGIVDGHGEDV